MEGRGQCCCGFAEEEFEGAVGGKVSEKEENGGDGEGGEGVGYWDGE